MKDLFTMRLAGELPSEIEPALRSGCGPDETMELATAIDLICDSLSIFPEITFEVGGFGQEAWPVDVTTDLAVVVEQIPSFVETLVRGEEAELAFYEQGIERYIHATRANQREVALTCACSAGWTPSPGATVMDRLELTTMAIILARKFVSLAEQACPEIANGSVFKNWRAALSSAAHLSSERRA